MPVARMRRPTSGGRPDGSGGGCGGSPMNAGASLAVCVARYSARAASSSADGSAVAGDHRAHLVEAGVDDVHGLGDATARREAAAGGERGASHQPGRPDVAVDAALVAEPVREPSFAEQLVELRPVRLGDPAPNAGDQVVDVGTLEVPPGDRDRDRPEQRVGQLERGRLRDVEAVERAVADEVEVARDRRSRVTAEARAARRASRAGSSSDSRSFIAAESGSIVFSRSSSADPPADTGAAPRSRPSSSACEMPVQSPTCARKSPVGIIAAGGVAHVLRDHRASGGRDTA